MQCDYFDEQRCRSCTMLGTPYVVQLETKQQRVARALADVAPDVSWVDPFTGRESGFRNKAKLVAGGSPGAVTLGILDREGHGVDLQGCGLYEDGLGRALPVLARFVDELRLVPYDVPARKGELKYLIVTHSPTGELMVRFILRTRHHLERLTDRLNHLMASLPQVCVVSANLHPEHKAVLEGDTEIVLTERDVLPMPVNGVPLVLHTRSFFQTNTEVAAGLYRQATAWGEERSPTRVWDLFCGVGGFGLHLARPGREVLGVEVAAEAIDAASRTAEALGVPAVFRTADATSLHSLGSPPDLVVVNPPRRGLGPALTDWLEHSPVPHVLYSSCNVETLARDLAAMPSYAARRARLFDMFPQTGHHEVLIELSRKVD
jgi:23S rRNA (uracil747-C5)-methyltransferase